MARTDTLGHFLTDVADSIRTKTGSQATIQASAFDTEIANIPSGGDDWSDIGYSSMPKTYKSSYDYTKEIYDNWNPNSPTTFTNNKTLIVCPLIDTSKMSNMSNMFRGCTNLKEVPALNTSNATSIYNFFQNCSNLEYADLSNFDLSKLSDVILNNMFSGCSKLASLDLSTFNTSNITDMRNLFNNCSSLTSLDLSTFNTSNVSLTESMFYGCSKLTSINFGNNFNLSNITSVTFMFYNCKKIDNNTLNQILHICTTVGNSYTGAKKLTSFGIDSSFDNFANIPNLSNYQDFLDAGWTIS